jgi:hypothetical protein
MPVKLIKKTKKTIKNTIKKTVKNDTKKNKKTLKRNCEKKFCDLYTRKLYDMFSVYHTKEQLKDEKLQKKIKNQDTKMCKLYFCNEGCKGTLLQKGKRFPKLDKIVQQEKMYGKEFVRNLRKELFENKTDILVENVHEKIPSEITKNYKEKGALSICDHYIPNGSVQLLSKRIMEK